MVAALTAHTLTGIKCIAIRRPRNGRRLHCPLPAGRHRLKGVASGPLLEGSRVKLLQSLPSTREFLLRKLTLSGSQRLPQ
jgi:hypothetical protein